MDRIEKLQKSILAFDEQAASGRTSSLQAVAALCAAIAVITESDEPLPTMSTTDVQKCKDDLHKWLTRRAPNSLTSPENGCMLQILFKHARAAGMGTTTAADVRLMIRWAGAIGLVSSAATKSTMEEPAFAVEAAEAVEALIAKTVDLSRDELDAAAISSLASGGSVQKFVLACNRISDLWTSSLLPPAVIWECLVDEIFEFVCRALVERLLAQVHQQQVHAEAENDDHRQQQSAASIDPATRTCVEAIVNSITEHVKTCSTAFSGAGAAATNLEHLSALKSVLKAL